MIIESCIDYLQIEPVAIVLPTDKTYSSIKANGGIYYCANTDQVYVLRELEQMLNQGAIRYLLLQFNLYRLLVRQQGIQAIDAVIKGKYFNSLRLDSLLDLFVLKYYGRYFTKRDMLDAIKAIIFLAYKENSQQLRTEFKHNDLPLWCMEFGDYVAKMLLHLFFYIPRKYAILNFKGD